MPEPIDEDRTTWVAYATHEEQDPHVIRACRTRGIDPTMRLRRCRVCGAKEYIDRGRLMVQACSIETHTGRPLVEVPAVPRRTGEQDEDDQLAWFQR